MRKIFILILLSGLLIVLLTTITELPPMGELDNPSFNEISHYYNDNAANDTGSTNIVTAIITDYRAFDTLGEITVLFTGITAVVSILGIINHKGKKEGEDIHE
ncbi:hydrogen gas-evolving membrane-bound hydrogenase subunit E [Amphibacillus indicireducens]|uniref:MrpA C-terminal/MbhE domain-containing protein n=1 Tax=Amphibacillus indicireducens TaxID=1076330 RepID=A0ABP7V6F8_9BACI